MWANAPRASILLLALIASSAAAESSKCDVWDTSFAPVCLGDNFLQLPRPIEGVPTLFCEIATTATVEKCSTLLNSETMTHHVSFEEHCTCADGLPAVVAGSCVDVSGEWGMVYYGCEHPSTSAAVSNGEGPGVTRDASTLYSDDLTHIQDPAHTEVSDTFQLPIDASDALVINRWRDATEGVADNPPQGQYQSLGDVAFHLPIDASDALLINRWANEQQDISSSSTAPQTGAQVAPQQQKEASRPQDSENPLDAIRAQVLAAFNDVLPAPTEILEEPTHTEAIPTSRRPNTEVQDRSLTTTELTAPAHADDTLFGFLQRSIEFDEQPRDQVLPLLSHDGKRTTGLLMKLTPAPVMAVHLLGCEPAQASRHRAMQLYIDGQAALSSKRGVPATISVSFGPITIAYVQRDHEAESVVVTVGNITVTIINDFNCNLNYRVSVRDTVAETGTVGNKDVDVLQDHALKSIKPLSGAFEATDDQVAAGSSNTKSKIKLLIHSVPAFEALDAQEHVQIS